MHVCADGVHSHDENEAVFNVPSEFMDESGVKFNVPTAIRNSDIGKSESAGADTGNECMHVDGANMHSQFRGQNNDIFNVPIATSAVVDGSGFTFNVPKMYNATCTDTGSNHTRTVYDKPRERCGDSLADNVAAPTMLAEQSYDEVVAFIPESAIDAQYMTTTEASEIDAQYTGVPDARVETTQYDILVGPHRTYGSSDASC